MVVMRCSAAVRHHHVSRSSRSAALVVGLMFVAYAASPSCSRPRRDGTGSLVVVSIAATSCGRGSAPPSIRSPSCSTCCRRCTAPARCTRRGGTPVPFAAPARSLATARVACRVRRALLPRRSRRPALSSPRHRLTHRMTVSDLSVALDPATVRRTTLPNGLRVLVRRDASAPVVAIVTYVSAGYFDETDDVIGIAHVLEHMYFKERRRAAWARSRGRPRRWAATSTRRRSTTTPATTRCSRRRASRRDWTCSSTRTPTR